MSAAAANPATRPRLWKAFLAFLGPMMLANILQALSGTINNVYLGQMLGVGAMASVSAFFPILFFFISFMIGLGAGASVLIGQAWGAREVERVKAIAGTTLSVGIGAGLLVAVFGGAFTGPMLTLLGTPADILPGATSYARIMLIAAPGIFVFLLATSMMRGVSDTVTPLLTLLISTAIGLVLTPALIRGWGGLPMMGVASGAWASVASYSVALLWLGWYMLKRQHPLAPDAVFLHHMKIDRAILARVLRIGLPTAVQMITISLAEVAVLFLVNRFGSDATAAYGAVNQVVAYVQFPAISIAITASILGAQAIGAGRINTLGAIARTGILMNLVITGALVVLAYLFSRTIVGFFITSAPVVEVAQTLLHIMLWSSIVFGMSAVLSGLMRASGSVLVPTAISMFAILAIEVPVAWGLSHRIGLNGIWMAYPVAFLAMLAMQTSYYRLVWRKRPIRRL
ncbi:MATE family efflux transporter [Rhodoferax sediminis]|jgi:putative MATE family efflux protein|nr:MATE family efflux transporter [Rhodoferax sediminis]